MLYKEADKSKDNKVALDTAIGAGLGAGALVNKYNNIGEQVYNHLKDKTPQYPEGLTDHNDIKKYIHDTIRLKNKFGYDGPTAIIDKTDIYHNSPYLPYIYNKHKFKSIPLDHPDFNTFRPSYKTYTDGSELVFADLYDKYSTAHEYGHATGTNLITRINPKVLKKLDYLRKKVPYTAITAGALYDTDKSLAEQSAATKVALGATAVTGLSNMPVLAEEARASIRGAKALKDLNLSTYRETLKRLGPAYFTYFAPAVVAPIAGYTLANKVSNKLRGNENKNDSVGSIVGNTTLGTVAGAVAGGIYGNVGVDNHIRREYVPKLTKKDIEKHQLNSKEHKQEIAKYKKENQEFIENKIKSLKTPDNIDTYKNVKRKYQNRWGARGALLGAGLGAGYGLYNYIKNRKQQQ